MLGMKSLCPGVSSSKDRRTGEADLWSCWEWSPCGQVHQAAWSPSTASRNVSALCPSSPHATCQRNHACELRFYIQLNSMSKTTLDFTGARDSEWQWHQLGHMQICTSLQTDNHTSTSLLSFLQARCPSCHPTNSIKALKAPENVLIFSMMNTAQHCCGVFTARRYASAVYAMALCLSVCVTSWCSTKTAKHKIMQMTPHETPGDTSFLTPKFFGKFHRGHPQQGHQMQVG